jgi:RHH-type rel operon transcriptional repressor/antitoxin RelB
MLSVRLPEELENRLNNLARATRRSKSYYVREAIERSIEDLEDAYLAESAYEEFLKKGMKSIGIEELEQSLGLDD